MIECSSHSIPTIKFCDKDLYFILKFYAHNYLQDEGNKIIETWNDGYEVWSKEPGFHAKLAIENYKIL